MVLLALHLEHLPDALLGAGAAVDELHVGVERAREHAHEVDAADVRVGDRLERVDGRRRLGRREHDVLVARARRDEVLRRRGHALDDQVEQGVRPLVLGRRAAGDGEQLAAQHLGVQRLAQLVGRDLLAVEVLRGEVVGDLDDRLDQALAPDGGLVGHVRRDRARLRLARAVARVLVGDHVQHVDDAAEVLLAADRDRDRDAARRQLLLNRGERGAEIGTVAIEVVDEDDARLLELVAAAPQPCRHDLDPGDARDREERALDHPQRAQGIGDEARVTRGIEDVELVAVVLGVQQRARDRHRASLLVFVVIRHGAAVGDRSQARDRARLEEQRFRQRRLTATAVADECDVANLLGRERHHRLLPESTGGWDDIAHRQTG